MFLVGLIGRGIQASLSPALHERAAAREGFRYTYRLIDLEELKVDASALPYLLQEAEREGYRGVNITHPCKQTVIPHLDELSSDARSIGAVNTVVFQDGRRIGYNTDCWGFAQAFEETARDVKTRSVVQLGAGGAGAAVAHAALSFGAQRLLIADKDAARAERLADDLCARFGRDRALSIDDVAAAMQNADGLIHATPTGMARYPGLPLPAELIQPSHWVAEIVYFPLETELLRVARNKGCLTIDGSGMAVYQAVGAFQLFTGATPDAALMRKDFDELVAARQAAPAVISAAAQ
jgi:shikimate dehydrogenase